MEQRSTIDECFQRGLVLFFQPIVGTFLGWLLLGETIGITFWIGTILIFSGVFIVIKDE